MEAAVHTARRFVGSMEADTVMAKLDFANAFNTLRRDSMLEMIRLNIPSIYNFCKLSYGSDSWLNFRGTKLLSQEGCQQGDPLGPLLFSLTIQPIVMSLRSDLVLGYLDDLTLGGEKQIVADDIIQIESLGRDVGLTFNRSKCELIQANSPLPGCDRDLDYQGAFKSFKTLKPIDAELLGAPLSCGSHMDAVLGKKVSELSRATDRLARIQAHDSLVILQHATGAPNLMYMLRASPCSDNPALKEFNNILRLSLTRISNCALSDQAWLHATLPVANGGLGIRSVFRLAPSAFLASAAATSELQSKLL